MKIYDKLCSACKGHIPCISRHAAGKLYIIDRTKSGKGKVEIHEHEPDLKGVTVSNPPRIEVYFDNFPERAFKINNRECKKQFIHNDKHVHAVVSFPLVDCTFDSWAFTAPGQSIDDIRQNHGIIIRCTNRATIFNEKVLLLGI